MSHGRPARNAAGRSRATALAIVLATLAVAGVALIGFLVAPSIGPSATSSTTTSDDAGAMPVTVATAPTPPTARSPSFAPGPPGLPDRLPPEQQGALGEADGVVPPGVTVFDDAYPAVANLDPALLRALRQAATDAGRDQVTFSVDSGWRSSRYQEQLLEEAIAKYGSQEEAARWVATPGTSAHVSGDAVDIGPAAAAAWLSEHGADYGLCQIYRNEPWHYELRPDAVDRGCPAMYADPTHDPRMQQ